MPVTPSGVPDSLPFLSSDIDSSSSFLSRWARSMPGHVILTHLIRRLRCRCASPEVCSLQASQQPASSQRTSASITVSIPDLSLPGTDSRFRLRALTSPRPPYNKPHHRVGEDTDPIASDLRPNFGDIQMFCVAMNGAAVGDASPCALNIRTCQTHLCNPAPEAQGRRTFGIWTYPSTSPGDKSDAADPKTITTRTALYTATSAISTMLVSEETSNSPASFATARRSIYGFGEARHTWCPGPHEVSPSLRASVRYPTPPPVVIHA